jgi:glycosyltransferase involved in cell wall biosynthesis
MTEPLVSVAVVTYNQRPWIEQCLHSILAQDYPNFEIVVADDASTDGTGECVEQIARAHPGRFNVRHAERNRGVTGNHNAALAACRGDYLSWIGGDDLMLPGKLSAQVAFMQAHPACAICYHDVELFDSDSGATVRRWAAVDRPRRGGMATLVRHGNFNAGISSMVRRSASPERFDDSIPVASDWLYYVECLAGGGTIDPIDGMFARQRRGHGANVTGELGRSLQTKLFLEHLQSCAIILGRWPKLAPAVCFRMSRLMAMQRWQDDGTLYRDFLRASLGMSFRWKLLAALFADRLFGIRR